MTTLTTRTKAPFVIVYLPHPEIMGYAYTEAAARTRARRKGFRYAVLPVVAGKVAVPA